MEIHTGLFGVTRPPSESLPERGKWLKSKSEEPLELEPNLELEPQPKLEKSKLESEEPLELEPNLELEPQPKLEKSKLESEEPLELEPNLELEPQPKLEKSKLESEEPLELEPNLELEPQPKLEKSKLELESNLELEPQPKLELESNLVPKSKSEIPKLIQLLDSKPLKKLKMSDFSMYDDDPEPFIFACRRFVYKNKAQIIKEEQIKIAMDDYRERSRNLSRFDAISRPEISDTVGGGPVPLPITEDVRLRLTPLCKLALDKYNDDKDTHFVFANIVKSTSTAGAMYYITFLAQDSSNSLTTFQTQVFNRKPGPKVYSCAIKT